MMPDRVYGPICNCQSEDSGDARHVVGGVKIRWRREMKKFKR